MSAPPFDPLGALRALAEHGVRFVVIGGIGRIEGPIVGTIVYFALRELLADYGAAYLVVLGLVAIAVVVVAPRGLCGLVESRVPGID